MGLFFFAREMFFAFFLFTACLFSSVTAASVDTGIAWLKSQQRIDGGFSAANSQATEYQATVEALLVLDQLSSLEAPAAQMGGEFLHSALAGHLEEIANSYRLAKIDPLYFPVSTAHIIEYKSASGGYGDYPGYESTVSASAILAHALTGQDAQAQVNINELIAYLLAKQKLDKGWAEESNRSAIYVSALVSRALQAHRFNVNLSNQIHSATEFLLANQKQGGGWATNLETAVALLAVVPAVADSSRYKNALDQLVAVQLPNGSWNNDVYTTALALQVMHLVKKLPVIEEPTRSTISGYLINATTHMPVYPAQVVLDGPGTYVVSVTAEGRFNIDNISPGIYSLTFTAPAYQQINQPKQINLGDRIDLGAVSMDELLTSGLIHGRITDAITQLPLSGVSVQISGDTNTQIVTDQQGHYFLELEAGDISIAVAPSGYHTVSGGVNVEAGVHYNFSPALNPMDVEPLTEIQLRGTLLDAETGLPLVGARIQLVNSPRNVFSAANGTFLLAGLDEGAMSALIEKEGYQTLTLNATAVSNSVVDAGVLRLVPVAPNNTALYGVVRDIDTGEFIANAAINISGSTIFSDAQGVYEINNIESEIFAISVSASGYQDYVAQLDLPENERVKVDIPLKKIQVSGIAFNNVAVDKPTLGAYEQINITGEIRNSALQSESLIIQAQLFNAAGELLVEFPLAREVASESQVWDVAANSQALLQFPWFSEASPPGQYRILLSAYTHQNTQLVDQHEIQFQITATQKLASLRLLSTPEHINQGALATVNFQAALRNKSNVTVDLLVKYKLIDPNGNEVFSDEAPIAIEASQIFSTVNLGAFEQVFGVSGIYRLEIEQVSPVQPELIEGNTFNVRPDIHIEIEQALSPERVVPGAAERIRVQIRLEGSEVE